MGIVLVQAQILMQQAEELRSKATDALGDVTSCLDDLKDPLDDTAKLMACELWQPITAGGQQRNCNGVQMHGCATALECICDGMQL